jgi:hypothetical protein
MLIASVAVRKPRCAFLGGGGLPHLAANAEVTDKVISAATKSRCDDGDITRT